jgi:SAM-dependent methyltransferase
MGTHGNPRLDRIRPLLVCPACRGELAFGTNGPCCRRCRRSYTEEHGRINFLAFEAEVEDDQDRLKSWLKRLLGRYYYTIGVDLIAPNYPFNFGKVIRRHVDPKSTVVLDVGSGNMRLDEDIICLDLFDYPAVDVVCDVGALPFRDGSVGGCVSRSMLEHVRDPHRVVAEFHRVTAPGGFGAHLIPFLMPFHASPYDFHRFTDRGAAELLKEFEIIDQWNPTGPISTFLNVLIEFLAVLFSFGNKKARAVLYLGFCGLLFPLKLLDFPFVNRSAYLTLAANIMTVVRKPEVGDGRN